MVLSFARPEVSQIDGTLGMVSINYFFSALALEFFFSSAFKITKGSQIAQVSCLCKMDCRKLGWHRLSRTLSLI